MEQIRASLEKCVECNLCVKECAFLKKYGNPKAIGEAFDPTDQARESMPFECSLCGLCTAVCPVDVNPARAFLEMRREIVRAGGGDYPEHAVILNYESRGSSRRYTWYSLPRGCDTVFFPGCSLPGTRPDKVLRLYLQMKANLPNLGIVLDCCGKPSHDLGREKRFDAIFGEIKTFLIDHGVHTVLVACPNCRRVFSEYGGTISVRTVYEVLAENGVPENGKVSGVVTVHDPCALRFGEPVHGAVREIIGRKGLEIAEMPHRGEKTFCCGEGGSVGFLSPEFSKKWCDLRKQEAQGWRIVTYCAGCANFLGRVAPTSHILDLVYEPEATLAGKVKVSKAPFTYWNRIRLKARLKRMREPSAVTWERGIAGEKKSSVALALRVLILLAVVGAIAAVRMTGVASHFEPEALRNLIRSNEFLAPIIYMLIYTIAPSLFLPGLPITIAGGLIFGPFWGVVYTITSSTAGACLAFLISRYVARDWIERKLKSPRWRRLDGEVERQGWKVVAITRLIPLFPFNLLNYAFGLTRIKFAHYALTTFICMLPACIAFIVFSSSLGDLLSGRLSFTFLIGILLIVLVSIFPIFYRRWKRPAEESPALSPASPHPGGDAKPGR
ncbi:MAG: VTT domain-containing protein [Syntrophobacter sp.]